jgi:hypothetical protein
MLIVDVAAAAELASMMLIWLQQQHSLAFSVSSALLVRLALRYSSKHPYCFADLQAVCQLINGMGRLRRNNMLNTLPHHGHPPTQAAASTRLSSIVH